MNGHPVINIDAAIALAKIDERRKEIEAKEYHQRDNHHRAEGLWEAYQIIQEMVKNSVGVQIRFVIVDDEEEIPKPETEGVRA